ncbi:hypothetical protein CROQUDRAFT_662003 [Cronartium quercuum f. sp. fusiforme G11]|uniref:1-phosphatidylinositol-4-phosphate 5-kinase n=1 Tax=Cronartium quercuum f. sp. fusiforme G11 TaxID=708437 RepID=A0A9P6NES8_9BASI|nr:hypothetical protein CROQUDRAFT_662003 [Cronartium quercuum f. sp. fusiforme G11]
MSTIQAFVLPTVYRDSDDPHYHHTSNFKSSLPSEHLMNISTVIPSNLPLASSESFAPSPASSSTGHEPTLTSASSFSSHHQASQRSPWAAPTSLPGRISDGSRSNSKLATEPFENLHRARFSLNNSLGTGKRTHNDDDGRLARQPTQSSPPLPVVDEGLHTHSIPFAPSDASSSHTIPQSSIPNNQPSQAFISPNPANPPGTPRATITEHHRLQSSGSSNFSHAPPDLTLPPAVHQSANAGIQRSVSYEPVLSVLPPRISSRKLPAQPPMAKLSPPRPDHGREAGSRRDEFEDEVERQAEAMRQERLTRRITQAQESGSPSGPSRAPELEPILAESTGRDKGKGRASGIGMDSQSGVLVGNLISEGHVNYVLMYNMLTGIRIGVSRCQAKLKRPLTAEDYTARHKFSFDIVGNELTPSAKYDFKFKDYAPWVFRELREYFHLDPADYLLSLTAKYILSELGSPGKSGSFFYFSRDYRFIIKTIHHGEHKFLRRILHQYHEHVKANPHTLLSRFYGLHRVKLPRGPKIHFVIMNNLFPPHRDIHETYDLKGSAVGREYPEEKAKAGAVLKDLNWIHRSKALDLGPMKRGLFEEQLKRDTKLLQSLGIMDYSLLIGLHDMDRGNRDRLRDDQLRVFQPVTKGLNRQPTQIRREQELAASALRKAVQQSDPQAFSDINRLPLKDRSERKHFIFYQDEGGLQATDDEDNAMPMIYYLGIIDILTPYSSVKKFEHFWKGLSYDKHMISAVPPEEYGNRFLNFLFSIIRGADLSLRPRME